MDGYKSDFPDNSFDAVFCNNNLYYVLRELNILQAREIFGGIGRLVRQNGHLVISSEGGSTTASYIIYQNQNGLFVQTAGQNFLPDLKRIIDAGINPITTPQTLPNYSRGSLLLLASLAQ